MLSEKNAKKICDYLAQKIGYHHLECASWEDGNVFRYTFFLREYPENITAEDKREWGSLAGTCDMYYHKNGNSLECFEKPIELKHKTKIPKPFATILEMILNASKSRMVVKCCDEQIFLNQNMNVERLMLEMELNS